MPQVLGGLERGEVTDSAVDIYGLPSLFKKVKLESASRLALVFFSYDSEFRFFETTMRNRGYDVRVFDDVQEGVTWLTREQ